MSSVAYGMTSARRVETPPPGQPRLEGGGTQPEPTAAEKTSKSVIDALAAIVPAEALLVYIGFVVPNATKTTTPRTGALTTTVTDSGLFKWAIPALAVLSAVLYLIGKAKALDGWDIVRVFIPATAFVCWAALQTPSGIEAAYPDLTSGSLRVGAAIGGVFLAALAVLLGFKADSTKK